MQNSEINSLILKQILQKMKRIQRFSILIFCCSSIICCNKPADEQAFTLTCLPANLQDNIVAFYPFNNGSLNDVSGNNNHLTNITTASPGEDRNGNIMCAFTFNRINGEYLECTTSTFLNDLPTSGFSVSLWYKMYNQSAFEYAILISRGDEQQCVWTTGQWSLRFVNQGMFFGANGIVTDGNYLQADIWHHTVLTAENNEIQIFVDGEFISSSSEIRCSDLPPTFNSGNLLLGKHLNGLIDDVIIYDRILSPSEVSELYNIQACCN